MQTRLLLQSPADILLLDCFLSRKRRSDAILCPAVCLVQPADAPDSGYRAALSSHVSRFVTHAEFEPIEPLLHELENDLSLPIAATPPLHLSLLVIEGMLATNYDAALAKRYGYGSQRTPRTNKNIDCECVHWVRRAFPVAGFDCCKRESLCLGGRIECV